MTDQIIPYYNRELAFLRKMGAEFAEAHPKIAGRLRLSGEVAEDPHVARILEGFAYLTARIRHKLDDDFPELTEAMLGILYPHYLAPLPSVSIIQFELDKTQTELTAGYKIAQGSALETEAVRGKGVDGETCQFRTCYDVTVWPMTLQGAEYRGPPFRAPPNRFASEAKSVVRLQLSTLAPNISFSQFTFNSLRFFFQAPAPFVYNLHESVLNNTMAVAIANSPGDREAVILPRSSIKPVGFDRHEAVLPYSARSFDGYRLLSEFFSFPEKYLFFDVTGIEKRALSRLAGQLEIYLYLDRYVPDLEKNVDANNFQLGCTPIVNLYRQRTEPIQLTHTDHEYRVVPDARRPIAHEIYSIDRVVATSPQNEQMEFQPFYSVRHASEKRAQRAFWHATRRAAGYAAGQVDRGTEVFLSLVDLDFEPSAPTKWTLDIEATCLNRDLPRHLPYGAGQPRLQLTTGAPLGKLRCVTPLSATQRPALHRGTMWRLISHLSLNHLSLVSTDDNADALREILRLYDYNDSPETRSMIDGLVQLRGRRIVGRVGGPVSSGFCRGFEVTAHLDEERFSGSGIYLFAAVLERFMGLYTSLNSFTKFIATTNKREEPLAKWPPRAGEQILI